jgi:uncharacterized membrane protein YgaE (UPF0421/DUF939 family)
MIRLPAAAIGAALAMFFDFIFGQVALTFALAALFTIYICHLLRWDDAIIVATLTAVSMIPLTEEHFLLAFLIRLGTSSIGIIISTFVNFIIMPPNFNKEIIQSYDRVVFETKSLINDSLHYQLKHEGSLRILQIRLSHLMKGLERVNQLINYQREEYRYHRHNFKDFKMLNRIQKRTDILQKISFHIGDMLSFSRADKLMDEKDKETFFKAWDMISRHFFSKRFKNEDETGQIQPVIRNLHIILHKQRNEEEPSLTLSKGSSIAYEILAIHTLLEKINKKGLILPNHPET